VPAYRLNLFNGFDLTDGDGATVAISSRKGRCLLAFLALSGGRKVARDALATLLWGDRGETQARRSLSQELYRLRGLFPEEAQGAFSLESERVSLDAGLFESDVARFERGLDAGDSDAASLYTGELLAGLSAGSEGFDDWLAGERERLRGRALAALSEAMRGNLDSAPDRAEAAAERALALDPAHEEAHRALIQLHHRAGRRDRALKQYEKCRAALTVELGVQPGAATRALYEEITSCAPAAPAAAAVPAEGAKTLTAAPSAPSAAPLALPDKPSIAVLPFDNMSGDPEQDYFADGIADDIITELSRFRDLFVIARNSSFTYKGAAVDIKKVGRELGVRYVLEGGVRKAGERVRITAQLIEAETGSHLWAEKYDGELADIFDLQDRITTSVVPVIHPTVFLAEIERARRKRQDSLDAYDLRLRGFAAALRLTRDGFVEAMEHAGATIKAYPEYGGAHTLSAWVNYFYFLFGWSEKPKICLAKSVSSAKRAVELDESDALAHSVLAWSLLFGREFDDALAAAERGVHVNPNLASAVFSRAMVHVFIGRAEEAVEECELAIRLSPRDPYLFGFLNVLAVSLYALRRYEKALDTATRLVALRPDYLFGHWHVAIASAQLGELDRARRAFQEILRLNPDFDRAFVEFAAPFRDPDELEHEIDGLRKAGWEG
jgi:TolB-like protein/Tfp pilus assembly protein PilF